MPPLPAPSPNALPLTLDRVSKVAIWGASIYIGGDCLRQLAALGKTISFLVDRNAPEGGNFLGHPLHGVEYLLDRRYADDEVDCVILTMWDPSGPRQQLRATGFDKPILSFGQGADLATLFRGRISPVQAFRFDDGPADQQLAGLLAAQIAALSEQGPVALYGAGRLATYLERLLPELTGLFSVVIDDDESRRGTPIFGQESKAISLLPGSTATIFCASLHYNSTARMQRQARSRCPGIRCITVAEMLAAMPREAIPVQAWVDPGHSIYPIELPELAIRPRLDFLLMDVPPRFLGMMPNGLAYVHNLLAEAGVNAQTVDLDLIYYHRYHQARIMDGVDKVMGADGYAMVSDPWSMDSLESEWSKPQVLAYFQPWTDEVVAAIVAARPKILGLSLHGTNLALSREIVRRVRVAAPETVIMVGGYDCIQPNLGPRIFTDFDYMVIFEAETSLGPLVRKILAGQKARNLPGVISRYDNPALPFVPAAQVEDLDSITPPRYEWTDISLYRNHNGYQLAPVVLTRGCRWSKCTFCAERFAWRKRSARNVADEIEWLYERGCRLFHFNDSDLSGDPATVREMCEEIMARGLDDIGMLGQLRVQKGYTPDYFQVLARAGFKSLRYGIDGWAKNTLKLHRKGYTLGMIDDVIGMTKAAGIQVGINLVIGIPHETEDDIDETIANLVRNKSRIDRIENLNTLILAAGSLYWEAPEKYGIHFREDREVLYGKHAQMIPPSLWYSVDPYIDQAVRVARLERLIAASAEAHIPIGNYASWKAKKIAAS